MFLPFRKDVDVSMSHLGYRVHQRINNSGLGSNKTPNQPVGSIKSWSKLRILKNRNSSSSSRSWVIWICNFCTSRRIPALSHVHFFARNAVLRDSQCTKRCVFQPHLRSGKSKVGRVMGCQWLVHARIILGSVSDQSPNSSDVSWVFHHIPRTDGFAYSYRVLHGRLALQDSICVMRRRIASSFVFSGRFAWNVFLRDNGFTKSYYDSLQKKECI